MYPRMDLTASEARRDAKKKYDLSLKRIKQNVQSTSVNSVAREMQKLSTAIIPKTCNDSEEFGDSQNIMLRLSDSFTVDDTFEEPKKTVRSKKAEVILISDSSEDCSSPEKSDWMRFKSSESTRAAANNGEKRQRSVYLVKSSDSEDNEKRKESVPNSGSATKKIAEKEWKKSNNSFLYTSDSLISETDIGTSFNDKNNIEKRENTPETLKIKQNIDKSLSKCGILTDNRCNIMTPDSATILKNSTKKNEILSSSKRTPISAKISSRSAVLSNKDTRTILKAIKSTRQVYDSPAREWKKSSHVSDSDSDENDEVSSPVHRSKNKNREIVPRQNGIVIAETESDSDSDDEVIQGSRVDSSRPYKTHVSRFLDPAISDEASLSEKKKLEVAQWLLTNTQDSRSDSSSISNISPSQRNSPNSGNSSLERLELNYETPNNRGKLKTPNNTGAKSFVANSNSTKSTKFVKQTTIDTFVKTSKDGTQKILTPVNTVAIKKNNLISPAVQDATEALGLMDCADILDNLYGKTWRDKANDLIPVSEPRKTNVARKDKGVQTERKINPRSKKLGGKSSDSRSSRDDDFAQFVKDIRPNLNSTKKPAVKITRRRCSFIDDSSSSENDNETTYMTALTNPRISDNRKLINRETPISAALQRVRAICDTDSDDDEPNFGNKPSTNYRKQLSFSDDESSTNTSEYDPSDIIPPKLTPKPVSSVLKTTKNATKVTRAPPINSQQRKVEKTKTFLESLSASIPLNETHPDARKYRQNFKNTKEELCKYLYKLYNEKIFENKLPSDMSIEWNVRMRGTAGFCYNKRSIKALGGVTRSSRLVLATKILDTPDRLRDTLVHEMCHAAAWLINEVSDGHGPFWKGWASKAMKTFPELPPISRCHDYDIKTKFTYRCVGCGYSVGRHSKSLDTERKRCGHCYGKFELLINKVTKSGTVEVKTPTTKKPTAFALFVKENYSTVKKERKGVAHKEVMQILGQQFSAIKISKKNGNSDDNNSDGVIIIN